MRNLFYRSNGFKTIVCLLALFVVALPRVEAQQEPAQTQGPPAAGKLMQWHETFTYNVRYSFFNLGKVKVEMVSDTLYHGEKNRHLQTIITSNSHIPFVGKEENHYNSIFDISDGMFRVKEFWADNVDEHEPKVSDYIYDRKKQLVYTHDQEAPDDTLALEEPASSGHIIFYQNRMAAGTDTTVKMPIYINGEKKYMTLENTTKKEKRGYDAFPEDVETYYSRGHADFDGPFGFSGDFQAWYLTDELRVPVEARVKVWLGHVKVKLIDYKKERRSP